VAAQIRLLLVLHQNQFSGSLRRGPNSLFRLLEPNADHPIFNLSGPASGTDFAAQAMLAAVDMELPAMPWACDHACLQSSFSERSTGMRADAVQHMIVVTVAIDRKDTSRSDYLTTGPIGKFCSGDQREQ
jgi:hypothetical protein